ncbi:D-sedoheptulose 7-phosphate isomerase [Pedobacter sp. SD-b]|uniref:Phosphoheptose isomerase n=1 Tax=Pedobacter segetis TaxID=2793069 RepID=A0ABS1BMV5_9SPHI|nr:D-sedoheptulose 7-phosphate isomerase [Pedobacter segetis]MBK0384102.1 D-sedoheptulose 7-phosphate isomerase [Pedobacter segetis]
MIEQIKGVFADHAEVVRKSEEELSEKLIEVCNIISNCITAGKKVLLFGNGGSASDAQHIAAEFVGRFLAERRALPAIALTTDTSALTAIANDYGYEMVFSRQVEALANKDDVVIGISTSGNSQNVLEGLKAASQLECKVIGFSGNSGGKMNDICEFNLVVPSNVTARIQEVHILLGHIICMSVDKSLI